MITVLDRPTIELVDITLDFKTGVDDKSLEFESQQQGKYPLVYFKGIQIDFNYIEYLRLYNNKFLPAIEISFRDMTGKFQDELFPLDDEIISIFIRSSSDVLMPIRMDFKIQKISMEQEKTESNNYLFNLEGILNVDDLYDTPFASYAGTSYTVLRQVAKENSLGFASNINDTNDSMTWINPSDYIFTFINHISEHSYLSDDTFLWAYVDFYYNLNYVDIETQLKDKTQDLVGATDFESIENSETQTMSLKLSNHPDYNSTNMYIDRFNLINESTKTNMEIGYKTRAYSYDILGKTFNTDLIDSISDSGDNSNLIVLKGQPNDMKNIYTDLVNNIYMGCMDTDNVHKNFYYSFIQNSNNINFLQKVKMLVTLKRPNFNLYRFQNIKVEIYKLSTFIEDDDNQTKAPTNQEDLKNADDSRINTRLSGDWLITAINFKYDKKEGNIQEITLVKREMTAEYNKNNS